MSFEVPAGQEPAALASLFKKLSLVMRDTGPVEKKGLNKHFNYEYMREEDLIWEVRERLVEHGISFLASADESARVTLEPAVDGKARGADVTRICMVFTFGDVDTGAYVQSRVWGEGQDAGDKGGYKAMTGATKYFLWKTFLFPTGDDPEHEVTDKKEAKRANVQESATVDKDAKEHGFVRKPNPFATKPKDGTPKTEGDGVPF